VLSNWARSGNIRAVFLCCPDGVSTFEVRGDLISQDEQGVTILTDGERIQVPSEELVELEPLKEPAVLPEPVRWGAVCALVLLVALMLRAWCRPAQTREWVRRSWSLASSMLPPLVIGVFVAGMLLGGRGEEGLIPRTYIEAMVGESPELFLTIAGRGGSAMESAVRAVWPLWTNLFASVVGVLMYFATLTEVPIVRGLMRGGMGQGPALALLLAGPAVSLPNMLVIWSIMGGKRTLAFVGLVVLMATLSGILYGAIVA
jgi:uncharacterized membrane protein YraQ (UPF0718 family)